jgi:hypothetical protein
MERISLLRAGEFLLGIDTSAIVKEEKIETFVAAKNGEGNVLIHLASFLSQESPAHLDKITGGMVIASGGKQVLLVFDEKLEEISAPVRFEPLPLLYPELAKACCPKIFVHKNEIVLLLDPEKLESVYEQLGASFGRILISEFLAAKESGRMSS